MSRDTSTSVPPNEYGNANLLSVGNTFTYSVSLYEVDPASGCTATLQSEETLGGTISGQLTSGIYIENPGLIYVKVDDWSEDLQTQMTPITLQCGEVNTTIYDDVLWKTFAYLSSSGELYLDINDPTQNYFNLESQDSGGNTFTHTLNMAVESEGEVTLGSTGITDNYDSVSCATW